MKLKYYAVRVGAVPGIYSSWDECKRQVLRFPGCQYKSFSSRGAAELFMAGGGVKAPTHKSQKKQQRSSYHEPASDCYQEPAPRTRGQLTTSTGLLKEPLTSPVLAVQQALAAGQGLPSAFECCTQHTYCLAFDGASRGNPGLAGCGAVFVDQDTMKEVLHLRQPLPYGTTNNEAEYAGLIMGLQAAVSSGMQHFVIQGDSQLVIRQLDGVYQVKSPRLLPFFRTAMLLFLQLHSSGQASISMHHVLREDNTIADRLSNEAVDMQLRGGVPSTCSPTATS